MPELSSVASHPTMDRGAVMGMAGQCTLSTARGHEPCSPTATSAEVTASPGGAWVLFAAQAGLRSLEDLRGTGGNLGRAALEHAELCDCIRAFSRHRIHARECPTGMRLPVEGPEGPFSSPIWAPDGRRFFFLRETHQGVELWIVRAASGRQPA